MNNSKIRILLIGPSFVGKSNLANRLIDSNIFETDYIETNGVDYKYKEYYRDEHNKLQDKVQYKIQDKISFHIYDLSGSNKYFELCSKYIHSGDLIIYVYDISDDNSYKQLFSSHQKYKPFFNNNTFIVVGNKADKLIKNTKITTKNILNYKNFVISAKTKEGIKDLIDYILNLNININVNTGVNIKNVINQKEETNCCCDSIF